MEQYAEAAGQGAGDGEFRGAQHRHLMPTQLAGGVGRKDCVEIGCQRENGAHDIVWREPVRVEQCEEQLLSGLCDVGYRVVVHRNCAADCGESRSSIHACGQVTLQSCAAALGAELAPRQQPEARHVVGAILDVARQYRETESLCGFTARDDGRRCVATFGQQASRARRVMHRLGTHSRMMRDEAGALLQCHRM